MDRRTALKSLLGLGAALVAERVIPHARVWSFPREIRLHGFDRTQIDFLDLEKWVKVPLCCSSFPNCFHGIHYHMNSEVGTWQGLDRSELMPDEKQQRKLAEFYDQKQFLLWDDAKEEFYLNA